ncbi:MAG: hypothetical protein ACLT4I_02965 [Megamonas funiformis]|uniref:hypothetical protein n=1 Tax=Megamonas funiformis TaxID=437897 RepID=UPI0039919E50
MQNLENKDEVKVHKLTINGGKTKLGEAENIQVEIFAGQSNKYCRANRFWEK